jgi:hypothetical protein
VNKNKKIFLGLSLFFFILVLYIAYDISTRTTFPGSHKLPEEKYILEKDTNDVKIDSIKTLEYL